MRKKEKPRPNPLFAIAALSYRDDVLILLKHSTYGAVSQVLDQLIDHFGHQKIQDISKIDIQKYVALVSRKVGPESVSKRVGILRAILENSDDDYEFSKRINLPKRKKIQQDFYTVEEMQKVFYYSVGIYKILFMFLAETGCRIGEALALRPSDFKSNIVSISRNVYEGIEQDSPKTDSSVRSVCLTDHLTEEVKHLFYSDNSFLFKGPNGRPMWPQVISSTLKEVCKRAQISYKSLHAFRRGNITSLILTLKIPESIVGMRSGHLSGSVLLGVYCKPQSGQDEQYLPEIGELFYGNTGKA